MLFGITQMSFHYKVRAINSQILKKILEIVSEILKLLLKRLSAILYLFPDNMPMISNDCISYIISLLRI